MTTIILPSGNAFGYSNPKRTPEYVAEMLREAGCTVRIEGERVIVEDFPGEIA